MILAEHSLKARKNSLRAYFALFLVLIGAIPLSAQDVEEVPLITNSKTLPQNQIIDSLDRTRHLTIIFGNRSEKNPNSGRGQTFVIVDQPETQYWNATAINLITLSRVHRFEESDRLHLWLFEWAGSDGYDLSGWDTTEGEGLNDGDPLNEVQHGHVLLRDKVYQLPSQIGRRNYLTIPLPEDTILESGKTYAFFVSLTNEESSNGSKTLAVGIGASGRSTYEEGIEIRTVNNKNFSANQDLSFSISAVPSSKAPIKTEEPAPALLALGSPFQNGMILQRDKPLTLWGKAKPSSKVALQIQGKTVVTTSNIGGEWVADIPPLSTGGPYRITIVSEEEVLLLEDILIGDVWLAFGQSNMGLPIDKIDEGDHYLKAIKDQEMPIRFLRVESQASLNEEPLGTMSWQNSESSSAWSAVATIFAHDVYLSTKIPIGIISASWGSTPIEAWMPRTLASSVPSFRSSLDSYYEDDEVTIASMLAGTVPYNDIYVRSCPTVVYNQMIHPLLGYGLSGFLYYQEETNAKSLEMIENYKEALPALVQDYRARFQQGNLPFLAVQLPSFDRETWPWFREAQSAVEQEPNTHLAVTIDTGDPKNIHSTDKKLVGQRLALLARRYAYEEDIEAHGPRYISAQTSGNTLTVTFAHAERLRTHDGQPPSGFEVAGEDGVFYPVTTSAIKGETVELASSNVSQPLYVRYAWVGYPSLPLNLVNGANLPATPFRNDELKPPLSN